MALTTFRLGDAGPFQLKNLNYSVLFYSAPPASTWKALSRTAHGGEAAAFISAAA